VIVSLIYAQAENGVIGLRNALPWHLPADLRHFKELTLHHTIVMGRRTWESIGGALPNRRSIVVSRRGFRPPPDVDIATTIEEALARCVGESEVFVIGGAQLFAAALPLADRIYRTLVHAAVEGDVTFSPLSDDEWEIETVERREADDRNPHPLSFQRLRRRASASDTSS